MANDKVGYPSNPTAADVKVSEALQAIGGGLEDMLAEVTGKKYGFALFVFPFEEGGTGSYISNAAPESVEEVVGAIHQRLRDRLGMPPAHLVKAGN